MLALHLFAAPRFAVREIKFRKKCKIEKKVDYVQKVSENHNKHGIKRSHKFLKSRVFI